MEGQGGYVDSETCGWVTVGCTEHNMSMHMGIQTCSFRDGDGGSMTSD